MNDFETNHGTLENLDWQIKRLMAESKDVYFTEYLQKLQGRVKNQKCQIDLLKDELDRCYGMYINRMQLADMQKEQPRTAGNTQETVPTGEAAVQEEKIPEAKQPEPIFPWMDEEPVFSMKREPEASLQGPKAALREPEAALQGPAFVRPEFVPGEAEGGQPGPVHAVVPAAQEQREKKSAEFTVGAAVMSVVGGGLILAALVTLGMTFMGGIFRGLLLYGVSLFFLLVSELTLYRRWPMLGSAVTAIGIGGLYLSTLINFLGLHNFNLWVMLGITLGITVMVVFLSRKRDSALYRVIGLIAGYLCVLAIRPEATNAEFYAVTGMILFLNVLWIVLPVQKYRTAVNITHMSFNAVFAFFTVFYVALFCNMDDLAITIFIISSIIVQQVLFVAQSFQYRKAAGIAAQEGRRIEANSAILIPFYISSVEYAFLFSFAVFRLLQYGGADWLAYGAVLAIAVIGGGSVLALVIGKSTGKSHVYGFLNLMILMGAVGLSEESVFVTVVLILLVTAKIIVYLNKNIVALKINDILLTAVCCIGLLVLNSPWQYALLAGVFLCIFTMHYWQTVYQVLLAGTLVLYMMDLQKVLRLPAIVGFLLVCILAFHNVKRWRGKNIRIFNFFAYTIQGICFLNLLHPVYKNAGLTFFCMLIFGLATIIITLRERYQMEFAGKYVVLELFCTYMALVFRMPPPIVNSIILMVIALVCVGLGFTVHKKNVRIYGLVLSLVVCGKIVLYDFFEAPTIQKTILFFAVGMIALVIAGIYIILEKNSRNVK